ncbi:hypothetical protein [Geminicoccus harenae]|uniref:hypothetical protein n=1 Tax=Geminicoccus harenae TaxID=2498453 RepID=UPI00168B9D22|nr:hypothetical protein [Geminicoccus harenae]
MYYDELLADFLFHQARFSDLDSNGDGRVDGSDDNISIGPASFMGESRPSLVIEDVADIPGMVTGFGHITLFGVTSLQPQDVTG